MADDAAKTDALTNRLADLVVQVRECADVLTGKAGQLDEEGQAAVDTLAASIAAYDVQLAGQDETAGTAQATDGQ